MKHSPDVRAVVENDMRTITRIAQTMRWVWSSERMHRPENNDRDWVELDKQLLELIDLAENVRRYAKTARALLSEGIKDATDVIAVMTEPADPE